MTFSALSNSQGSTIGTVIAEQATPVVNMEPTVVNIDTDGISSAIKEAGESLKENLKVQPVVVTVPEREVKTTIYPNNIVNSVDLWPLAYSIFALSVSLISCMAMYKLL